MGEEKGVTEIVAEVWGDVDPQLSAQLAEAIAAKGGIHSSGLIGGIGIKAVDLDLLQRVVAEEESPALLRQVVEKIVDGALERSGIVYGTKQEELEAAVSAFVDAVVGGEDPVVVTRKVAEGEAPQAAESGRIDYPLNYHSRRFSELANLKPGSRRKRCTVVNAEDVIAIQQPPVTPKPGMNVKGESVPPPKEAGGKRLTLEEIGGEKTVVSGNNLLAECDGMCEEDAEGRLRVVPLISLKQVDEATGRVPESGVSRAHVVIAGDIRGNGVATAENLMVGAGGGGTIEGKAQIQARNLIVDGRIVGGKQGKEMPIEVDEICAVHEVLNRTVSARYIMALRDCRFAALNGGAGIWIGRDLCGGRTALRGLLQICGDLGSEEGESRTRIVLSQEGGGKQRKKKIVMALKENKEKMDGLRMKLEELEKNAEKRAKVDPYWAHLLQGEKKQPQGPMQMKALQQFAEYADQKLKLGRQVKGIKRAIASLMVEKKELDEEEGNEEAYVVVGGVLHLDVTFEVARELEGDDGDLQISFTHGESQFARSPLKNAVGLLRKEVNAYREQQDAWASEKQKAIDQMFEGQEKKPTVQDKEERNFELPFSWVEAEVPEDLEVSSILCIRSSDPQRVVVRNIARCREKREEVVVQLKASGAQGSFSIQPESSPPGDWLEDEGIRGDLKAIQVGDVSALEMMERGRSTGGKEGKRK